MKSIVHKAAEVLPKSLIALFAGFLFVIIRPALKLDSDEYGWLIILLPFGLATALGVWFVELMIAIPILQAQSRTHLLLAIIAFVVLSIGIGFVLTWSNALYWALNVRPTDVRMNSFLLVGIEACILGILAVLNRERVSDRS